MKPINRDRLAAARAAGDEVGKTFGSTVCFEWGVQSADGAWFTLLREPHHTDADITAAKRTLRNSRDVVSMGVEKLT